MKKMGVRIVIVLLLAAGMIYLLVYLKGFAEYQANIKSIDITEINIEEIADGEYIGEHDAGFIYAKVCVTIKNHKIEEIKLLEHKHERGQKAESIIDKMLEQQKIDVDAVSGATNSSKVIKQACVNALGGV